MERKNTGLCHRNPLLSLCSYLKQGPTLLTVRLFCIYRDDTNLTEGFREGNEKSFDWFKSYADLSDLVHELIPDKSSNILMLGCGNSKLSEDVRTELGQGITELNLLSSCGRMDIAIS